jgi:hypothetical protein
MRRTRLLLLAFFLSIAPAAWAADEPTEGIVDQICAYVTSLVTAGSTSNWGPDFIPHG